MHAGNCWNIIFVKGDTVCLYHAQLPGLYIQLFDYHHYFIFKFFFQKLQERQAAFKKLTYAEKDSEKWQKVSNVNFMISEENDVDGDDAIQI